MRHPSMTSCLSIQKCDENVSLAATIEAMQRDEITTLVVVNGNHHLRGYVHLHDILGRGGNLKITLY